MEDSVKNLRHGTQNLRLTLDLESRTRARVKSQEPGTEISEQGLVFIVHTAWTFIGRISLSYGSIH